MAGLGDYAAARVIAGADNYCSASVTQSAPGRDYAARRVVACTGNCCSASVTQ
jgi:hypothetical protein